MLQLSVAVGIVQVVRIQLSKVVKVINCGQVVKRGLIVSVAQGLFAFTVTVKEQIEVLPLASVAV